MSPNAVVEGRQLASVLSSWRTELSEFIIATRVIRADQVAEAGSGPWDKVAVVCDTVQDMGYLSALRGLLAAGATLGVITKGSLEEWKTALLLGGFIDIQASDQGIAEGYLLLEAQTPSWNVGAKQSLNLGKQPAVPPASRWTVQGDDDNEELVDDEELLTEEDRMWVTPPVAPSDCEIGPGRKACKNCSCGRAEQEAAGVKLTPEMLENPQSSCGNCALGDAFRCAGCPYRGLPAFQPGEKIQLPSSFLVADV